MDYRHDADWNAWNQAALRRAWGMIDPATVRREQFGDWKDLKQTTPRPEPKWKPCSASTLPDSPCGNGGVDDPFALDAMVIHGHPVMACNDDIWDCNMKVS